MWTTGRFGGAVRVGSRGECFGLLDLRLQLGGHLDPSQVRILEVRAPHRAAKRIARRRRLRQRELILRRALSPAAGVGRRRVLRGGARGIERRIVVRERRLGRWVHRRRRGHLRAGPLPPVGRQWRDGDRRRARLHLAELAKGGVGGAFRELGTTPGPREALEQRRPSLHVVLSTHVATVARPRSGINLAPWLCLFSHQEGSPRKSSGDEKRGLAFQFWSTHYTILVLIANKAHVIFRVGPWRSSPPRQSSPPRRRQWCCTYPSAPPSSCIPPSESDVP